MPEVSTDGPILSDLLKERGIPVFFDGKGSFFEQPEIEVFRNLLMLLDNPRLDLALLTVLVNPPFDFTEEELGRVRLENDGKGVPFWRAFDAAAAENSPLGLRVQNSLGRRNIAVRFHPEETQKKEILIDGKKISKFSDMMGCLRCVIFSPEDLGLIKEGPSLRRRYLGTAEGKRLSADGRSRTG